MGAGRRRRREENGKGEKERGAEMRRGELGGR